MDAERANFLIDSLELQPHPEGGYFRETYRSNYVVDMEVPSEDGSVKRNCSTAIYYLLTADNFSAFHRIYQDEMWHFYEGSTLLIHELNPDGHCRSTKLGSRIESGERFQYVVKGGNYFAVELIDKTGFGLAGCTVAPGFDFADFEMPGSLELSNKFPDHKELITRLTHH